MIRVDHVILRDLVGRDPGDNGASVLRGLELRGRAAGLQRPHRLAMFLAQVAHESGGFRHDREVWGPTAAQRRYEDRADLGHSPAVPGEAFLFRGRGGIQITGRYNHAAFRDWCRTNIDRGVPDFERVPDAILTEPWEGLGPVWFWETRDLSRYADRGDFEMVTRRINGGLNGYEDRLRLYTRAALLLCGYHPTAVRDFQKAAGILIDGVAGPQTRQALHVRLLSEDSVIFGVSSSVVRRPEDRFGEIVAPKEETPAGVDWRGLWARIVAALQSLWGR